jgi:hypothetical protein
MDLGLPSILLRGMNENFYPQTLEDQLSRMEKAICAGNSR